MSRIYLIDCTFRDGGYYNDWDFPVGLAKRYLEAAAAAKIDAVELGFRFFPQKRFLGAHAYTTDEFLRSLPLRKGLLIGVMVNAADLINHPEGPAKAVDLLFSKASRSPVGLVRIAVHFADLTKADPIAQRLKNLGYKVAVNLMQAAGKSNQELSRAARTVRSWKAADLLYFADSFGNLNPKMVKGMIAALKKGWTGPIGIHAHNNMGMALANSMAAIEVGASWLDGTILGMGRGAGNVQTEYLVVELKRKGLGDFPPDSIFGLALGPFKKLYDEFQWGPNLLYYLSATYDIHPTYIQVMLGKTTYKPDHLIAAIETLRRSKAKSFSNNRLEQALFANEGTSKGTWSASGWAKDRTVLLVAAGPCLPAHVDQLCRFIDKTKPLVVSLNAQTVVPPEKIDAHAACHKVSLLLDADHYCELNKTLLAPKGALPAEVRRKLAKVPILDYGVEVRQNTFRVGETDCIIPSSMAAAYAMAAAEMGGALRILFAGFDGYTASDHRQHDMSHMLRCYQDRPEALPLQAVTPTTYEIDQGSIYAPIL